MWRRGMKIKGAAEEEEEDWGEEEEKRAKQMKQSTVERGHEMREADEPKEKREW